MTTNQATEETFAQRVARKQAEAAVAEMQEMHDRNDRLAEIMRVERYQIRTIVDLTGDRAYRADEGAYVVEYRFDRRDQNSDYYWAAIVGGKHVGRANFHGRALATLHALAHLDGDSKDDGHGRAAMFAARVLGVPADTDN